ncbi:MAG TPA: c-type cytochrome [Hyphomicrobiales bacterium]|nr:c-type cytochrome [Hyphomicrobiales bacterium]
MTIHAVVKSIAAALLVTLVASPALAQTEGNAQAGKGKITVCLACHGESGNDSLLPDVPKLGGQGEKYLLKQLQDIKGGVREVQLMTGMLTNLNDQDLADIAAWYGSQEIALGAVEAEKRQLGEILFRAGNADIGVAACSACHGVDGKGLEAAGYPALSGQDPGYIEAQLKAFRGGVRVNDDSSVMRDITARLSDTEIAALASYVFGVR